MPINSFENYPMSWRPERSKLRSPVYRSLAENLERDIAEGRLRPGTKLPPQRELADYLDVNLSTITRAFRLCERKGLIYAIVGRGTFVSPRATLPEPSAGSDEYIELGVIRPYYCCNQIVADAAGEMLRSHNSDKLFEFDLTLGNAYHRSVAEKWLAGFGMNARTDDIVLTAGTQNALAISLMTLFEAGDKVITDEFTYPNFISLARQLRIQLVSVGADIGGMRPDLLERQCRQCDAKGIFLMPSCCNPTGIAMSPKRRKEIAGVIRERKLILIEDDTYGFLSDDSTAPLASLLPERAVYVHGLSKSLSAGLRIAYVVIPSSYRKAFLNTANNINLKIPLLNAELASRLISCGAAWEIIRRKREMSEERNRIFHRFFPMNAAGGPTGAEVSGRSFFQWLPLPRDCGGYPLEAQAKLQGVRILCSDRFAAGNTTQTPCGSPPVRPYPRMNWSAVLA
ncbi:aminotransferase-like domain-containing protein [Bacilliculturomica massiliensis]|uniref:aminotransferase-like domain-containing protein n=1 Tax=Bacilliculturomica massiliensis TaxID=1917867 RepID=UPI001A934C0C|nr:PLP-dependent aminotransferase family protein [Bacilliculturomica massiliensis]